MATANVRLTEKDNKMILIVKKKMVRLGMVAPSTADAVRFALNQIVEKK